METRSLDQSTVLDLSDRTLIDLLPIAAYAVRAPDGVIVWFNSQAVTLWGRTPVAGDLDERFCGAHRLYYPDGTYMAHSHTPVADVLNTGASVHQQDVVIERPDGSRVTVSVHIDAIRDGSGTIIGAVNFFYDVTDRKTRETDLKAQADQLEIAVEQRTASLSMLSTRLMHLQDDEWRRISRELHDGIGQHLAAAKMCVDAIIRMSSQEKSKVLTFAQDAQARLDAAIKETRTISHLFHPPLLDELGFPAAVRTYAEGFSKRSGITAEVQITADLPRMSERMEMAVFRIVQESLTNVHRHSGAPKVTISAMMDGNSLRVEISDNGKGFDSNKSGALGVGLTGIRERLRALEGNLEIKSGSGTRIIATVPLGPPERAS